MTSFRIKLNDERYDAIAAVCQQIERAVGLDNADETLEVEDLIRDRHFDLHDHAEIPVRLWPATLRILELAKEYVWPTDKAYMARRFYRLRKLLSEDAVTRLARLDTRTSSTS